MDSAKAVVRGSFSWFAVRFVSSSTVNVSALFGYPSVCGGWKVVHF